MMSCDLLESLRSVSYDGNLNEENAFSEAINEGFKSEELRNVIIWLCDEISCLANLDENITHGSDINCFFIELKSFLNGIQCSYEVLMNDVNNRMQSIESRYLLLEYLIGELMAQKMLLVSHKKKDRGGNVLTIQESPTAAALKDIAITLNLGKPPDNISSESLFNKITVRLDETLKSIPDATKRVGKPLFNPKKPLTSDQWIKIEMIQAALEEEYNLRRKMLMTRLDVTIQSFKWSERIKGKEKDITERFANKHEMLSKLQDGQKTDVASLLSAREKLAIIEKTSSANVRRNTKSKVQRHIMGKVPDRGGRALELQKPPQEMPSWKNRQSDNSRGGRGGNRGNFSQNRGSHQSGGYPSQHYQQEAPHNPSNYSGQNQDNQNFSGGSRVQGGWNPRGQAPYNFQGRNTDHQDFNQRGRGRGNSRR